MAEPVNPILIWAEQDVTLPGLDGANKTLPLVELSDIGWDKGQKPAADEFNYLLNNFGQHLKWHEESIGNYKNTSTQINGPTALTVADTGKVFQLTAAATGATITLPKAIDCEFGSSITLSNNSNGNITIQREGTTSENIVIQVDILTSLVLPQGYSAVFIKVQESAWHVILGDINLLYSPAFSKSLTSNGYQKLPGGLIIQWGNTTVTSITETVDAETAVDHTHKKASRTINLNISFPTACFCVFANGKDNGSGGEGSELSVGIISTSLSAFQTRITRVTGTNPAGAETADVSWIAIGY